ncbi:hypothetical protein JCM4814A_86510 [Streptomyces phaeofaciens JCM 4814]|uniref:Integral membrane protein n=2 Tax=Streptomyces phaeofaciens TaxID=68254 RepID=A0A918LSZ1_9ACTN|nr:hypothetical protein GCM10010226_22090 [Streptomyces phaeofaciens]
MTRMPGSARCARVLLAALVVAGAVCAAWLAVAAATFETGALGAPFLGLLLLAATGCALTAVASLVVSVRFAEGGAAVRVGAVAVGWVTVLGSLAAFMTHGHAWSAGIACGAALVALSGRRETKDWFERGRPLPRWTTENRA